MKPSEYYQQQLQAQTIRFNSQQAQVFQKLDQLYLQLINQHRRQKQLRSRILRYFVAPHPIKGLFLWGKVGIGKTWLMDQFCHCLPIPKQRMHFHSFIQWMHQALKQHQGTPNPIKTIIKNLAKKTAVLCFDECSINNIGDAMILGEAFKRLFAEGVCLVFTSNVAPDNLYLGGFQRIRFLPTIEWIKSHTIVCPMTQEQDYRQFYAEHPHHYYYPCNAKTAATMNRLFLECVQTRKEIICHEQSIQVLDRGIAILKRSDTVIWFESSALLHPPRAPQDYLALANQYHTMIISNIPIIKAHQHNLATALINLIDVLYDHQTKVILSAEGPIETIYTDGLLLSQFKRTQSRLTEMQSDDYFNK